MAAGQTEVAVLVIECTSGRRVGRRQREARAPSLVIVVEAAARWEAGGCGTLGVPCWRAEARVDSQLALSNDHAALGRVASLPQRAPQAVGARDNAVGRVGTRGAYGGDESFRFDQHEQRGRRLTVLLFHLLLGCHRHRGHRRLNQLDHVAKHAITADIDEQQARPLGAEEGPCRTEAFGAV